MVGSLLPGFREFRTPLVAGCLYFLCAWLAFGSVLLPENHPKDRAAQRLQSLIDLAGPGVTLAALGVAAYLVGSLLVIRRWPAFVVPIAKGMVRHRGMQFELLDYIGGGRALPYSVRYWLNEQSADPDLGYDPDDPEAGHWEPQADYVAAEDLANSFEELVTSLRQKEPSLYDEYMRLQVEAELRWSIMIPFAAAFLIYGVTSPHHWIAALGPLASIVWLLQGDRLHQSARMVVWTALMHGVIDLPEMTPDPDESV